jgi:hypothetical protein
MQKLTETEPSLRSNVKIGEERHDRTKDLCILARRGRNGGLGRYAEALFETAMRDRSELRHDLARLLHERHPRTQHPAKPA